MAMSCFERCTDLGRAPVTVTANLSAQGTAALLIGCAKGDYSRPIYGKGKRVSIKGGIRRNRFKGGFIPEGQWAKGDLDNMERLMICKGIPVFNKLNYVEQHDDGCYARGKLDILRKVDAFFKTDKTHFVLYFTGHGDEDGSWVIPVTKRFEEPIIADSPNDRIRLPVGGKTTASTTHGEVLVDFHEPRMADLGTKDSVPGGTPLTPPVSPNVNAVSSVGTTTNTTEQVSLSQFSSNTYLSERPRPAKKWNECVTFDDILQIWDNRKKSKKNERFLMLILDCCHSGRWVEMVNKVSNEGSDATSAGNESDVQDRAHRKGRRDICVQAGCRSLENVMVTYNQLSSVFTKAFVAAQTRSHFEKFILSALDHIFVLNVVSMYVSSKRSSGTPISSNNGPFGGLMFFDSYDDMYLKTS